jgi:hypothetical protein
MYYPLTNDRRVLKFLLKPRTFGPARRMERLSLVLYKFRLSGDFLIQSFAFKRYLSFGP